MQTACFTGCMRPPRAPSCFLGSTPPGRALGSPRHGESPTPNRACAPAEINRQASYLYAGFCLLPDEGGRRLFRKQPHLPVDLIDPLVAEQPYVPKGAHQMV